MNWSKPRTAWGLKKRYGVTWEQLVEWHDAGLAKCNTLKARAEAGDPGPAMWSVLGLGSVDDVQRIERKLRVAETLKALDAAYYVGVDFGTALDDPGLKQVVQQGILDRAFHDAMFPKLLLGGGSYKPK